MGPGGSKLLRCIAVVPGQGRPFLPWLLNQEKGVGSVYFLRWLCEFSEVPQAPIWVRGRRQVSRGSDGEYQADEQAGVTRLRW